MRKLHRKIMRGIYFAYALRLVSLPGVWQGSLMFVAMTALTQFVSLRAVISNAQEIAPKQFPIYIKNALLSTEIWTLLLLGVFFFLLLSFRWSIRRPRMVDGVYSYARI